MARNVVVPLVVLAAGGAAIYTGITNPAGGGFAGLARLIRGEPAQRATADPSGFTATAYDLAAVTGGQAAGGGGGVVPTGTGTSGGAGGNPAARSAVLGASRAWLGTPYKWGGTSRAGADCSGFTQTLFREAAGVNLPRVSAAQALVGTRRTATTATAGDLVFFGSPVHHVGLYLGGGMIRHAPHRGTVVRDEKVWGGELVTYRDVLTGKTKPKVVSA